MSLLRPGVIKQHKTNFLEYIIYKSEPFECSLADEHHNRVMMNIKWPYAITRLTIHFACGLMSVLVICREEKGVVIHGTKCPYCDQVSFRNLKNFLKNHNMPGSADGAGTFVHLIVTHICYIR